MMSSVCDPCDPLFPPPCTGFIRAFVPDTVDLPQNMRRLQEEMWNISNGDVCQSRELYIHQTIMFSIDAIEKITLSKWLFWIGGPIELTKVRNNKFSRSFTMYLYPEIYIDIWCTSLPLKHAHCSPWAPKELYLCIHPYIWKVYSVKCV